MSRYQIEDFSVGEHVYHLSNRNITMVIIEINNKINEINCRWLNDRGEIQNQFFLSQELGKAKDLGTKAFTPTRTNSSPF